MTVFVLEQLQGEKKIEKRNDYYVANVSCFKT